MVKNGIGNDLADEIAVDLANFMNNFYISLFNFNIANF